MSALAGTRPMLRLVGRRERLHGTAWYGLVALLVVAVAEGIAATYPTQASRAALAASVSASARERFLIGPLPSTDVGGIGLWRTQGVAAIFLSRASIFAVVRNTRAAEENGTGEILGAAAAGRAAPLVAALGVAAAGSAASGLVVAAGFVTIGATGPGSVLVGAQVASFGILAAALAAFTAQTARTARAATGAAVAVVGAFYLLRGTADAGWAGGRWLSPFCWIAATRPFAGETPFMLLPALALAAAVALIAIGIASRRDVGAGLVHDRVGRAQASAALRGPISLALRVSRATILAWAVAALLVGVLIGAVATTVDGQLALHLDPPGGGHGLVQVALYLSPLFAATLGVQTTLRLRDEVTSGRAEAVLSRPVSRTRWLLAPAFTGAVAGLALMLAFGLGLGVAKAGAGTGYVGTYVLAGAARAPVAWLFAALTALLLATVPRAAAATAFAALGAFLALEFAVEFNLAPAQVLRASPLELVPQLPNGPAHAWQVSLVTLISAALCALAAQVVRHQDVH